MPLALPSKTPGKTIKTRSIVQAALNMHKCTLDLQWSGQLPPWLLSEFAQVLRLYQMTLVRKGKRDAGMGLVPILGPAPR